MRSSAEHKTSDMSQVPSYLICPLSNRIFEDPVRTFYGTVFDRLPLKQHILRYHTCPQTKKPLNFHLVFPDSSVKKLVDEYTHSKTSQDMQISDLQISEFAFETPPESPATERTEKQTTGSTSSTDLRKTKKRSLSNPTDNIRNKKPLKSPTDRSPRSKMNSSEPQIASPIPSARRTISGSHYGRAMLGTPTNSPPSRSTLSSTSIASRLARVPTAKPAEPRWFRGGRHRWKIYADVDNIAIESAYQNGIEAVKLSGRQTIVNIQERLQISTNGTKRPVIRGTYFIKKAESSEWFPISEEVVEKLEECLAYNRMNYTVALPEKTHCITIKAPNDIRRYPIGSSMDGNDYIPVYRGYAGETMPGSSRQRSSSSVKLIGTKTL